VLTLAIGWAGLTVPVALLPRVVVALVDNVAWEHDASCAVQKRSMIHEHQRYPQLGICIGGRWLYRSEAGISDVVDPATQEIIGALPHAGPEQLDAMLAAAAAALPVWRATPPTQRCAILCEAARLLCERADAIATMMTREQGRPLAESKSEVVRAADLIVWNAQAGYDLFERGDRYQGAVRWEPIGVVAAITPWNVPVFSPARKVSMSLAAGCTCILKASEDAPASAAALVQAFIDARLPEGVLSLAFGVPDDISRHLITSPVVRKITFTGATGIGKRLAALAGDNVKPTTMELGGHAPVIVLGDADPIAVGKAAAAAKFRNAGQICTSPTRFYVQAGRHDAFLDAFTAAARAIKVGNGFDPTVQMGPLANARRLAAIESLVKRSKHEGARIATGGARIGERGYFYAPTVLTHVASDNPFMREEPFGPLAGIVPFVETDEAIVHANGNDAGLAAYVFGNNADEREQIVSALQCGVVGVNTFIVSSPKLPFGGVKDSGHGREGGYEGIRAFLASKAVVR
jgi:succinate-semialdehyde dehydrogenase/glutarate-semialdehyde dehydrogenase